MFCPNCRKQINDDAKFCDGCGTEIVVKEHSVTQNDDAVQDKEKKGRKIKSIGKFIGGIFLVLLEICLIIDIFFFNDGLRAFDDGVLSIADIMSFIITIGVFGGIGTWLLYKSIK